MTKAELADKFYDMLTERHMMAGDDMECDEFTELFEKLLHDYSLVPTISIIND